MTNFAPSDSHGAKFWSFRQRTVLPAISPLKPEGKHSVRAFSAVNSSHAAPNRGRIGPTGRDSRQSIRAANGSSMFVDKDISRFDAAIIRALAVKIGEGSNETASEIAEIGFQEKGSAHDGIRGTQESHNRNALSFEKGIETDDIWMNEVDERLSLQIQG
jgi:hypothetical protein